MVTVTGMRNGGGAVTKEEVEKEQEEEEKVVTAKERSAVQRENHSTVEHTKLPSTAGTLPRMKVRRRTEKKKEEVMVSLCVCGGVVPLILSLCGPKKDEEASTFCQSLGEGDIKVRN